jgi:hypothetical protein
MKRLWWWVTSGVVAVGLIILVILLVLPKNPIPGQIKAQVTSTLLVPQGSGILVDRLGVKYDAKDKLLTYTATYAGTKLTVSEQPTPDQFVDIPAVYTKLTDGLNNYLSFDANIGTVHLTLPKELAGKQAAVVNTKGTLMFVKPDTNLSDDQWRKFFNAVSARN